jgi:hypothetical protein
LGRRGKKMGSSFPGETVLVRTLVDGTCKPVLGEPVARSAHVRRPPPARR